MLPICKYSVTPQPLETHAVERQRDWTASTTSLFSSFALKFFPAIHAHELSHTCPSALAPKDTVRMAASLASSMAKASQINRGTIAAIGTGLQVGPQPDKRIDLPQPECDQQSVHRGRQLACPLGTRAIKILLSHDRPAHVALSRVFVHRHPRGADKHGPPTPVQGHALEHIDRPRVKNTQNPQTSRKS